MHASASTPQPTARSANLLRELVAEDLLAVNREITTQGHSAITLINDLTTHIVAAGGKRLRPSLTIAAAKLCGYEGERHIRLAACVEFIHTATLMHDDVVDASDLRRGAATANALWGNKTSVLVGDFLLSRAFQLMVADGSLEVLKILSDTSAIISAGEVHQLMVSHDLGITQETYEQVIGAKTAALFAAACELGAVVSDKLEWRVPLRSYGQALGMAFQIVDDALDYQGSASDLGKTIGDDFRDGKVTLPVILAYAKGSASERHFWEQTLENGESLNAADLARATALLNQHQTLSESFSIAARFAHEAQHALSDFSNSPAKAALLEAADFALQRAY